MERLTRKITNIETGGVLAYTLNSRRDELKAYRKLGEYEDAEEQGRLLIPRFKRGEKVYILSPMTGRISEYIITAICVEEEIGYLVRLNRGFYFTDSFFERQIGKTVFITDAEAEAALEKMKGEEHDTTEQT